MKASALWCLRLTNRSVFRCWVFDNGGGGAGFEEGDFLGEVDDGPETVEEVVEEYELRSVVAFLWLSYCKPTFTRCFIVVMNVSGL